MRVTPLLAAAVALALSAGAASCRKKKYELACPHPVPLADTIWKDSGLLNGAETMSCVEAEQLVIAREGIPAEQLLPGTEERLLRAGWKAAEQPPAYKGSVLRFFQRGTDLVLLDAVTQPDAPNDLVLLRLARVSR